MKNYVEIRKGWFKEGIRSPEQLVGSVEERVMGSPETRWWELPGSIKLRFNFRTRGEMSAFADSIGARLEVEGQDILARDISKAEMDERREAREQMMVRAGGVGALNNGHGGQIIGAGLLPFVAHPDGRDPMGGLKKVELAPVFRQIYNLGYRVVDARYNREPKADARRKVHVVVVRFERASGRSEVSGVFDRLVVELEGRVAHRVHVFNNRNAGAADVIMVTEEGIGTPKTRDQRTRLVLVQTWFCLYKYEVIPAVTPEAKVAAAAPATMDPTAPGFPAE